MVRLRWFVLAVWLVVLVGGGVTLAPRAAKALQTGGFFVPDAEATQAAAVLDQAFDGANRNNVTVLFRAPNGTVDDPAVRDEIVAEVKLLSESGKSSAKQVFSTEFIALYRRVTDRFGLSHGRPPEPQA